jgi:glutaredoxin 3
MLFKRLIKVTSSIVEKCCGRRTRSSVDAGMRVVLPLFMSNELTLYSRAMCSWCSDAKDFLQSRGYKFTEIDVGRNRAAYDEMKEISDQSCVPTLVAGEAVLANFDVKQLEKFLAAHRIEP